MACVPGGNVMANVSGVPEDLALSTNGFMSFAVFTMPLNLFDSVIAWPLRLSIHGMTMGFTGEPKSPMVEAKGIPSSMWVAWLSPIDSLSRITAQEASFEMMEVIPN